MNLIYYYHLPKCAGTFIARNLQQNADSNINPKSPYLESEIELLKNNKNLKDKTGKSICYNFNRLPVSSLKDLGVRNECNKQINDFLDNIINSRFDTVYVHHHMGYPGIFDLKDKLIKLRTAVESTGGKLFLFTCIRETVSFIESKINYQANNRNNDTDIQRQIKTKSQHNAQCKYLLHNHSNLWPHQKIDIMLEDVIETYDFLDKVYTTKNVNSIKNDISSIINKEIVWDTTRKNVSTKTYEIPKELYTQLRELNHIDSFIYKKYE
jgi:hypothetical protein